MSCDVSTGKLNLSQVERQTFNTCGMSSPSSCPFLKGEDTLTGPAYSEASALPDQPPGTHCGKEAWSPKVLSLFGDL